MLLSNSAANVAYATCGDYLMIAGEDDHSGGNGSHSGHDGSEMPGPCKGPGCRGVPNVPLPSSPDRSLTFELERWSASLADELHSAHATSLLRGEEALLIPTGHQSRIDRPPRG